MAIASIGRWLVLAPAVVLLAACAPNAATAPAPHSPTSSETSADGGHPMVPLTGAGVIVPSDVRMDPSPKRTGQPGADVPSPATAPQMN